MKHYILICSFVFFMHLKGYGKIQPDSVVQKRTDALIDSSQKLVDEGMYDEALKLSAQALKLAQDNHDSLGIGYSLSNTGYVYLKKSEPNNSTIYFNQAIVIFRQNKKYKALAKALLNLGIAYKELAVYDKALLSLLEAIPYFEKLKDQTRLSAAYNTTANIYKTEKDYAKALAMHFLGLKIKRELKYSEGISSSLNNIGLVYKAMNNYDSALYYFKTALEMKLKESKPDKIANTLSNIGGVYELKKEYKIAEGYYLKSYELRKKESNKAGIAESLYELGALRLVMRKQDAAELYLLQSVHKAKAENLSDVTLKSYGKLRDLYKIQHNYEKALEYSELFFQLNDTILGREKQKALLQLEAKYEAEKKENIINDLTQEREKKQVLLLYEQLQNKINRNSIKELIMGIIGLLLIIVFLSILSRSRHKFAKKLDMAIRELHHRVMNNFQLLISLSRLQLDYIKDEEAKQVIRSSSNRVSAMVLIHKELYLSEDVTKVYMASYLRFLTQNLITVYKLRKEAIDIHYDIDAHIQMGVEKAITVGLLVNELVTNAFKYAFGVENLNPCLEVSLKSFGVSGYKLFIKDNGPGNLDNVKKTLGLKLAESQVSQLNGSMQIINENGLGYEILFK